MDHREAGQYWDANADAWTKLARAGYDVYRDHFNTPAFLAMLPDVRGLAGLDIGCGEGYNTRQFAGRGAKMTAIDISPTFIRHASDEEKRQPLGISYGVASAVELPFADASFDFATATMSLMDIPEQHLALREAHRVLRPGGFLQFSICHPCFDTPHRRNLRDGEGKTYALEVGRYYERTEGRVDEWIFSTTPLKLKQRTSKFRVPYFHRTLSDWLNMVIGAGFGIERIEEPRASDEVVAKCPSLQDTQIAGFFLHVRGRKP